MQDDLIFVGYRRFTSKSNNECYVLDFITQPKELRNGSGMYVSQVSVFVEEKKYLSFVEKNKLLSIVTLPFEIVGNKVRYII